MFPKDTRILIADDLATIRSILSEILIRNGYKRIVDANDGLEAKKKLFSAFESNDPFGLIICDWNMPNLTGIELLEEKNMHPEMASTPFLMVTIESEKSYVLQAITMGVNDFIVKPFNEQIVIKKIESIYNRIHGED